MSSQWTLFSLERNDLDCYIKNISVKDSKSEKRRNVPMNEVVFELVTSFIKRNPEKLLKERNNHEDPRKAETATRTVSDTPSTTR